MKKYWLTGNHLESGAVIYLQAYSKVGQSAYTFDTAAEAEQAMHTARTQHPHCTGWYVMEVDCGEDGSVALSSRERFRRDGSDAVLTRLFPHGITAQTNGSNP